MIKRDFQTLEIVESTANRLRTFMLYMSMSKLLHRGRELELNTQGFRPDRHVSATISHIRARLVGGLSH